MRELVLVGLSHKTAAVDRREAAIAAFTKKLEGWSDGELVVLATCNRVEAYAVPQERGVLDELRDDPALASSLYELKGPEAVKHLFRVAAGLDSLVVGESEILGQVKKAYETAGATARTGKLTNVLFQRAMFVGKKVRTETAVAEGPTSVPSLAASLAQRIFGDLRESRVLILGAGAMAEGTLHALLSQKAGAVTIVNRTLEKAETLAREFKASALPFDQLPAALEAADIVLCSTGAPEPVVTKALVQDVLHRRKNRPIFFIDIAVPRDVDPAVETLDHVYLYNIDDLETLVAETLVKRRGEIEKAQVLADAEAARFVPWYAAWQSDAPAALKHAPLPEESRS